MKVRLNVLLIIGMRNLFLKVVLFPTDYVTGICKYKPGLLSCFTVKRWFLSHCETLTMCFTYISETLYSLYEEYQEPRQTWGGVE